MLKALFQIALHGHEARRHAQKVQDGGGGHRAACPGHELWPVGERQAEQLANHRKGQHSRVSGDEVGRTSSRKEPASSSAIARMRGSMSSTALRRKASSTISRSLV